MSSESGYEYVGDLIERTSLGGALYNNLPIATNSEGFLDSSFFDFRVHVLSTAPSPLRVGLLWYDTANTTLKVYNGSTWTTITTTPLV